jgi:flagellin
MSRINTNVSSLIAQTRLSRSNNQLQESLTRLSTGLRINSGKDDPAGLIASETLRADITSTNKAITNSERANQLLSTADSALSQISNLLNDVRGLVTEAANRGVLSDDQIAANQLQVDSSLEAIDRIAQVTTFGGRKLLDGSLDFLTSVTAGASTISDLNIQQANLGSTGQVNVSVDISAAAQQALITNTSVNFSAGVKSAGTITFADVTTPAAQATGTVTLTNTTTTFTMTAQAGGLADGTVGNGTDVTFQRAVDAAVATGTITLTNSTGSLSVQAVAGTSADGTVGNATSIVIGSSAAATGATYNSGTNVITVNVNNGGTATLDDVASAINSLAGFNSTAATGGTNLFNATDAATYNSQLSGGSNGTTAASYNSTSNVVTVGVAVGATGTQVVNAINGLTDFNAAVTANGGSTFNIADYGTKPAPLTTGANAVTANDVITITSNSTGTAYNGTITFNTSSSVATNAVDVQTSGSNITVTVNNNSTYSVSGLATEIQSKLTGYTVAKTTSAGNNSYASATDAVAKTNLTGGTNDSGTGLSGAVVFKLSGSKGAEVFDFNAGSKLAEIVTAINLVADATGVEAVNNAGTLELRSAEYGSNEYVDVEVISEGAGGTFESLLSTNRDTGTDIEATVNGIQAKGKGNTMSLNTASLDLNLTVTEGSSTDLTFSINGGGALFQLGPEVVSNQQARIGISSVNTAKLGGVSGRLYELRSGNTADLSTDTTAAANIVDEVITKVTELRGRLGAFQRTTLETNINSLNDTLSNITAAESSIRDADFAAESAKLTRAQILTQAGTSVLQIANQNPQSVLSLLRG